MSDNLPARRQAAISVEDLRAIDSWEALGEFVSSASVLVNRLSEYGPGLTVVNDGSTGIYAQLRSIEAERVADGTDVIRPLYCEHGLRRSDYDRKDESGNVIMNDKTGKPERATTFYLA